MSAISIPPVSAQGQDSFSISVELRRLDPPSGKIVAFADVILSLHSHGSVRLSGFSVFTAKDGGALHAAPPARKSTQRFFDIVTLHGTIRQQIKRARRVSTAMRHQAREFSDFFLLTAVVCRSRPPVVVWALRAVCARIVRGGPSMPRRGRLGAAGGSVGLGRGGPWQESSGREPNDGARRCTRRKSAGKRRARPGSSQSDAGTPGGISRCGTGFPNTGCRRRRKGGRAIW
jgi:hypothetical protein